MVSVDTYSVSQNKIRATYPSFTFGKNSANLATFITGNLINLPMTFPAPGDTELDASIFRDYNMSNYEVTISVNSNFISIPNLISVPSEVIFYFPSIGNFDFGVETLRQMNRKQTLYFSKNQKSVFKVPSEINVFMNIYNSISSILAEANGRQNVQMFIEVVGDIEE